MAFIVPRKNRAWEIRESQWTPRGPRSRTLATFHELDVEAIEHARARASGPLDEGQLRRAALRAGAPVAHPPADRAAQDLLRELAAGRRPRRALRRLLADSVDEGDGGLSDAARAARLWIAASPKQRGDALRDLLLLADRLPQRRLASAPGFPGFGSAAP
ncbi:MAG TPA: hypothetical protein VGF04_07565 [Solirubrobacterales bacterium]|jgi:hypothetical protein